MNPEPIRIHNIDSMRVEKKEVQDQRDRTRHPFNLVWLEAEGNSVYGICKKLVLLSLDYSSAHQGK
jgi:hypothetical protein